MKNALIILMLFCSHFTQALVPIDGFNKFSEKMPQVLKDNWNSSFLIKLQIGSALRMGSSSLIYKKESKLFDELYFITNYHVIKNECPNIGKCEPLTLFQKAEMTQVQGGTSTKELADPGVEYTGVEIIKKSVVPDIALIKVVVPKSPLTPKPMKLARSCDGATTGDLYSLGYPGTHQRNNPSKLPIEDQQDTVKRWTQGVSTGKMQRTFLREGTYEVEGTTIDSIPGGSGGPVLNSKGEVVGIMKASIGDKNNGYAYLGKETPGALKFHSMMITCESLREFLDIEELKSCVHP